LSLLYTRPEYKTHPSHDVYTMDEMGAVFQVRLSNLIINFSNYYFITPNEEQ